MPVRTTGPHMSARKRLGSGFTNLTAHGTERPSNILTSEHPSMSNVWNEKQQSVHRRLMVHRLGGIGALSSHNCKLQPLLGCMLVQDLFTTQCVPNRDATPTSWRRVNDSGRHPIPVGAVVVHRQSGDKPGQLRIRQNSALWIWWTQNTQKDARCAHGARTVQATPPKSVPLSFSAISWCMCFLCFSGTACVSLCLIISLIQV